MGIHTENQWSFILFFSINSTLSQTKHNHHAKLWYYLCLTASSFCGKNTYFVKPVLADVSTSGPVFYKNILHFTSDTFKNISEPEPNKLFLLYCLLNLFWLLPFKVIFTIVDLVKFTIINCQPTFGAKCKANMYQTFRDTFVFTMHDYIR